MIWMGEVDVQLLPQVHMRGQCAVLLLLLFALIAPTSAGSSGEVKVSGDDGDWRNRTVDPSNWSDGPELEGSPMDEPRPGDPVIRIQVDYQPGHLQSRVEGEIIIELFEEWAPITVTNMVEHVEMDLYDGIFFHRVIDDFVTQSGDPTCKATGVYPATNPSCGSGGTGQTIPLEHNENLSHVDGAIGMARSQDPDSADSQWYIAETEAHGLDPENREDEGYATFGVVRDGMSHVRAIALVPTSDDPTGLEGIQNPASSAGRPLYEARIVEISMLGVILNNVSSEQEEDEPVQTMSEENTSIQGISLVVAIVILTILSLIAYRASKTIEAVEPKISDESANGILKDNDT